MKKILVVFVALFILVGCKPNKPIEEVSLFSKLQVITFEELDVLLENGLNAVVYYGWIENCGDSQNFQNNYLEEKLKENPEWIDKIYVVNLDIEIPEALGDKELRTPMFEKYGVLYSPTLIYYIDSENVALIEWTPLTGDPDTAIPVDVINEFFANAGY